MAKVPGYMKSQWKRFDLAAERRKLAKQLGGSLNLNQELFRSSLLPLIEILKVISNGIQRPLRKYDVSHAPCRTALLRQQDQQR